MAHYSPKAVDFDGDNMWLRWSAADATLDSGYADLLDPRWHNAESVAAIDRIASAFGCRLAEGTRSFLLRDR